ncbi:MAG TPA: enoyl-CoA hydratase/isomerase family protein [Pyrinomonadaceae bacterium]|nr:enoyl-CoA hydratase/isomerase family protein [Pyrinomonadaceae bacterium]
MASYETITVEKRGRVAVLTINRPDKLNALSSSVHREGVAALGELKNDDEVRVVVITGSGEKSFIAGADISEFQGQTPVTQRNSFNEPSLFNSLDSFPKPVIAMVNGFCLGGGNELAMACDIRIASENARFSQPEINLGIMCGGGGTQRLPKLVGEGRAMEMVLTGDMIDAATAERFGLVNHVYPSSDLEAETMSLAEKIAEKAPIALQLSKEAVKFASRSNLDEGLRREIDLFAICFSTEDKQEGVSAFLEKRKPEFKGK